MLIFFAGIISRYVTEVWFLFVVYWFQQCFEFNQTFANNAICFRGNSACSPSVSTWRACPSRPAPTRSNGSWRPSAILHSSPRFVPDKMLLNQCPGSGSGGSVISWPRIRHSKLRIRRSESVDHFFNDLKKFWKNVQYFISFNVFLVLDNLFTSIATIMSR